MTDTPTPRLYDLTAAVEYVRGLGATGVSICTLRSAISSGRLERVKLGKRFYVSQKALDAWILKAERRCGNR